MTPGRHPRRGPRFEICPVCFWEDDGARFRRPTMSDGANKVSLIEAHRNYQDFGACNQRNRRYVRPPAEDEPLDPTWTDRTDLHPER